MQVVPVERHISINDVGCIERYHSIANEAAMLVPSHLRKIGRKRRVGGWYVMASLAQKKPSDDRVYTVDVATGDDIHFNCSKLSKYVKKFNQI